jgi:hypothetical protein
MILGIVAGSVGKPYQIFDLLMSSNPEATREKLYDFIHWSRRVDIAYYEFDPDTCDDPRAEPAEGWESVRVEVDHILNSLRWQEIVHFQTRHHGEDGAEAYADSLQARREERWRAQG